MKKIVLLGLLFLSNATLFSAQGGAAVDQQSHVSSLQSIAALSSLQMMKKNIQTFIIIQNFLKKN